MFWKPPRQAKSPKSCIISLIGRTRVLNKTQSLPITRPVITPITNPTHPLGNTRSGESNATRPSITKQRRCVRQFDAIWSQREKRGRLLLACCRLQAKYYVWFTLKSRLKRFLEPPLMAWNKNLIIINLTPALDKYFSMRAIPLTYIGGRTHIWVGAEWQMGKESW